MKKKVVLFFPKLERDKPFHWFPLALLSIAAPIVASGFECVIIDERLNPDYRERLLHEVTDAVCLGISSLTGFQLHGALQAAKLVREYHPRQKIVWGGPHVTNLPEQCLASFFVDYVVLGFGEKPFKQLVTALYEDNAVGEIMDLGFRSADGEVIVNKASRKDVSELIHPLPYHLLDMPKYINPETNASIFITSYGCPAACSFCSTKHTMNWVSLVEDKVENDLANLMGIFQFKKCIVYDATLFVDEERARHICSLMIKHNLAWICDGRAAELSRLKDETWQMLAGSGLISITMGLESGSQRIIDLMKKGANHLEHVRKAVELCRRHGIPVTTGVVFGTPSETVEDLCMTFDFIKKLRAIHDGFRISTTFFSSLPGTGLYSLLEREYGYCHPSSLEAWAEWGSENHYIYNRYVEVPWIEDSCRDVYRETYTEKMTALQSIVV